MLAYLLKYDSTQGNYSRDHEITSSEDSITVDGKEIKIYKEADANNLPWGDLDVDVVLECTGFYTSSQAPGSHQRWRQEGRHLRSRRQRPAHHRLQRQP